MKTKVKIQSDGTPLLGDIQKQDWKKFSGRWATLSVDEDESPQTRKYFEGCLVKLFCFYHGYNWRDSKMCVDAREDIKLHFNGETRTDLLTGELRRVGKSTKGKAALDEVTQQLLDYLVENYGAPFESYDADSYKTWRDAISTQMGGNGGDYITYLIDNGVLERSE